MLNVFLFEKNDEKLYVYGLVLDKNILAISLKFTIML